MWISVLHTYQSCDFSPKIASTNQKCRFFGTTHLKYAIIGNKTPVSKSSLTVHVSALYFFVTWFLLISVPKLTKILDVFPLKSLLQTKNVDFLAQPTWNIQLEPRKSRSQVLTDFMLFFVLCFYVIWFLLISVSEIYPNWTFSPEIHSSNQKCRFFGTSRPENLLFKNNHRLCTGPAPPLKSASFRSIGPISLTRSSGRKRILPVTKKYHACTPSIASNLSQV